MSEHYNNLVEYLNDKYYDLIYKKGEFFYKSNWKTFNLTTEKIPYPSYSEFCDAEITSLYCEDTEKDIFKIIANVRFDVTIKGYVYGKKSYGYEDDSARAYVQYVIYAKFNKKFELFDIKYINFIDEKDKYKEIGSSTKSFLPYMKEPDLDIYAEKILEAKCSYALKEATAINSLQLAKDLGLNVKPKDLPNDVFGRIYFVSMPDKGIEEGTVYVDENKAFIRGIKSTRNTVIHECVHWFYHRKYFNLLHVLNPKTKRLNCKEVTMKNEEPTDLFYMEWQANSIAPRILVPTRTLVKYRNQLYSELQLDYRNDFLAINKEILKCVAKKYNVSLQLAKIRLIQSGFSEFIGIDETNLNNGYSYCTKNRKLERLDTYRIGFNDLLFLTYQNGELKKALLENKLKYIDGFVVINSPKFIDYSNASRPILKSDAFNHIDEVAIRFSLDTTEFGTTDSFYSTCFLCKKNANHSEELQRNYESSEDNKKVISNVYNFSYFLDDEEEDNEMIAKMNGTFNEAYRFLYDYYALNELSNSELSRRTKLSRATLKSYLEENNVDPSYKNVLAICGGLELRPRVAKHLLSTIGYNLEITNKLCDHLYSILINQFHNAGLDFWNDRIRESGIGDQYLIP